jgi:hypothetical protein
MITAGILAIAISGFLAALVYTMRAEASAAEVMSAQAFAAKQIEDLRASYAARLLPPNPGDRAWSVLYADYTNAGLAGQWQMAVPGLPNGNLRIFLFFNEGDGSLEASEAGLGRMRAAAAAGTYPNGSINGDTDWDDGLCNNPTVTAANAYLMVPILVRVTWTGFSGQQTLRVTGHLSRRG